MTNKEKGKLMKVRFHRQFLDDSMQTCFEPKSWEEFITHVRAENEDIVVSTISCNLYTVLPDTRINWKETWIIKAKYKYDEHNYPIAFSSGNIMELKECTAKQ